MESSKVNEWLHANRIQIVSRRFRWHGNDVFCWLQRNAIKRAEDTYNVILIESLFWLNVEYNNPSSNGRQQSIH